MKCCPSNPSTTVVPAAYPQVDTHTRAVTLFVVGSFGLVRDCSSLHVVRQKKKLFDVCQI